VAVAVLLVGCEPLAGAAGPLDSQAASQGPSSSHATAPRLDALRVAEPTDDGSYDRDAFGDGWADLDGDGCETRDEILARDLTDTVIEDGCDVKAGTLRDPYTDRTIGFQDDQWWTVHVDHIYPLAHAWRLGASEWTDAKRLRFANDPANLLAVDGPTNSSKGDSGPGEWVPLNRGYACTYARTYMRVSATYDLPVTKADRDSLALLLDTCP
jgi:hypothetical protein